MTAYHISNTISGSDIGTYEADDEQGALDAYSRDVGYKDWADHIEVAPVSEGEIRVVEVDR